LYPSNIWGHFHGGCESADADVGAVVVVIPQPLYRLVLRALLQYSGTRSAVQAAAQANDWDGGQPDDVDEYGLGCAGLYDQVSAEE